MHTTRMQKAQKNWMHFHGNCLHWRSFCNINEITNLTCLVNLYSTNQNINCFLLVFPRLISICGTDVLTLAYCFFVFQSISLSGLDTLSRHTYSKRYLKILEKSANITLKIFLKSTLSYILKLHFIKFWTILTKKSYRIDRLLTNCIT